MRKVTIFTGLVCVSLAVSMFAGCSSGANDKATKVSSQSATSSVAAKDQIFKVGDTIKVDNAELTVTKVSKSDGSDYDKPQKDGDEFVIVSVTIKNTGNDKVAYNPMYFKMKNSQGQITDEAFTTVNQSTLLQSGDLSAGGNVSGDIDFEESKGDSGLILQYLNTLGSTVAQIKLS